MKREAETHQQRMERKKANRASRVSPYDQPPFKEVVDKLMDAARAMGKQSITGRFRRLFARRAQA